MPQTPQDLRNCRPDRRNVNQSCCPCIKLLCHEPSPDCFGELGITSNRPHNCRPPVTKTAQDLHSGLHHQRISAQTVILTRFPPWLQFVVDLSGQMLTVDGVWRAGEVINPLSQMADSARGFLLVSRCLTSWMKWPHFFQGAKSGV